MVANVKHWILAARPKTLPAAVVPVLIAGGLASSANAFQALPWLICLLFSVLLQIGTNFANDYYDFIQGADDERRIGPRRAVASGWVAPETMRLAMVLTFGAALGVGSLLTAWGGLWLLPVGGLCVLLGVAYTGGPYPLGYNGWGDVFVFIFFGWVATGLTFYVQTGSFGMEVASALPDAWVWLAGVVPGALSTNLLVINNIRDAPIDAEVGKRTLVVRYGRRFGRIQYGALNLLACGAVLLFVFTGERGLAWLPLSTIPLMVAGSTGLHRAHGREAYQRLLGLTALILVLFGSLFSLGLMLSG